MSKEVLIARHSNEEEQIEFMDITRGNAYEIHKDAYGEYILDDNSDEFYLADLKKANPFDFGKRVLPFTLQPWEYESTNTFVRISMRAWEFIQEALKDGVVLWNKEWDTKLEELPLMEYEKGYAVIKLTHFKLLDMVFVHEETKQERQPSEVLLDETSTDEELKSWVLALKKREGV
ncbi:hypothetical protein [Rossellomorea marisflavi]|uniref:hypothetical protein n=1 Tax=Rossellomorea marisflavi TaxID=189381 RepID=UPI003F9F4E36